MKQSFVLLLTIASLFVSTGVAKNFPTNADQYFKIHTNHLLFSSLINKERLDSLPKVRLGRELSIGSPGIVRSISLGEAADQGAEEIQTILTKYRESQRPGPELTPEMEAQQVPDLEDFIEKNGQHPLVPSLRIELASYYRAKGRFSKALEHWSATWDSLGNQTDFVRRNLADHALVHGASLLASLGRLEDLKPLIKAYRFRVMTEPYLAQIWRRTAEAVFQMELKPGIAYRCGTFALNNVSQKLLGKSFGSIHETKSSPDGFTLAELIVIAQKHEIPLIAAVRSVGAEFIYPSVVHWAQNHYAAITSRRGDQFFVQDPTFIDPVWMNPGDLEEEISGYFLIPSTSPLPLGWRLATPAETLVVFGKGWPEILDDDNGPGCSSEDCCEDGPGGSGTGSGEKPCGMAFWKVIEPNVNLEVSDIPMHYKSAIGPDFVLNLQWRQRTTWSTASSQPYFADGWGSDLFSHIDAYPFAYHGLNDSSFTLYWGNGFKYKIHFAQNSTVSDQDYLTGMWAVRTVSGMNVTDIYIYFRNGSVEHYNVGCGSKFRLVSRADSTGKALTFAHDDPLATGCATRPTSVTTADGAVFNFQYDPSDVYRVIGVTGPNSRSVTFTYSDADGPTVLSSITDVVGIVSFFGYDTSTWWINKIVTPYGTNTFAHFDAGMCDGVHDISCNGIDRSIIVSESQGTKQVYLFYDNEYTLTVQTNAFSGKIPSTFASSQIPQNAVNDPPIQTLDTVRDKRNSHYWNRQQAASLSTFTLVNLSSNDFKISRTRHWLLAQNEALHAMRSLSWELPPSHNGIAESQPTFYDYAGKSGTWGSAYEGSNNQIGIISRRMPDSTTYYKYFQRNYLGMRSNVVERWVENSSVKFRTNTYRYASGTGNGAVDGLLILEQKGPYGESIYSRGLHPTYPDQIKYETNAVGEVTTFDFDAYKRVNTKLSAAGLLSTFSYNGSTLRMEKVVDSISGTPIRTNSWTWLNGYQRTHKDPRGLEKTFDYDLLGRLTKITHTDNTTEDFAYSIPAYTGFNNTGSAINILDLVTYKDRHTNYSRSLPNRNRQAQVVAEPSQTTTGQLGTETTLAYCGCGSANSISVGSNTGTPETQTLEHNFHGSVTRVVFPNSTTYTNKYDLLGRLIVVEDAISKTTNVFDNLNRIVRKSTGGGLLEAWVYDNRDRVIAFTNSAGLWTTNQFDAQARPLVRGYPDGGKEYWSYSVGYPAPTRYTNQLGTVTTWAYDSSLGKTNEIVSGVYTNSYSYSPAGDLLFLVDGKQQKTSWSYNSYGKVINTTNQANSLMLSFMYDLLGRITNRWSSAKGNTRFVYDHVGNLTKIDYPAFTDITYFYSALNRLTNMIDSFGTTRFIYNTAGDLISEIGPLSNSELTNNYHGSVPHLRTGMLLKQPTDFWTNGFTYDTSLRLSNVTSKAGSFTYIYSTGAGTIPTASPKIKRLDLPNTSYITNIFDSSSRVTGTYLRNSSHATLNSHTYSYNTANARNQETRTDGSYVNYTYDPIQEVKTAFGFTSGGTPLTSETKGYAYDHAQNLSWRTNNGAATSFSVNVKNELTYSYDGNGNMTSDFQKNYYYNDENQLTNIIHSSGQNSTVLVYDGLFRLRARKEYSWYMNSWLLNATTNYLYDGSLVIQERDSSTPVVSYSRGSDMSGGPEYAGGIGGLLARSHSYSSGNWNTHNYYHADGNGNITALVNSSQTISAGYRYDSFGNSIYATGTLASANSYRFSSKEWFANVSLYHFSHRFYDPNLQRWLNQDPIREKGGVNLHCYLRNSPISRIDPYGLAAYPHDFIGPLQPGDFYCPKDSPPGQSLHENAKTAGRAWPEPPPFAVADTSAHGLAGGMGGVRGKVQDGGPWDFKKIDPKYEEFGNFHYGVVGDAMGINQWLLENEAGIAQQNDPRTRQLGSGKPGRRYLPFSGVPPYGDQKEDNDWIKKGIEYNKMYPARNGRGPCG